MIAASVGLLVGIGTLWIASSHNPQGEFFDPRTGAVEFSSAAPLFVIAVVAASSILFLVELGVFLVFRGFRKMAVSRWK